MCGTTWEHCARTHLVDDHANGEVVADCVANHAVRLWCAYTPARVPSLGEGCVQHTRYRGVVARTFIMIPSTASITITTPSQARKEAVACQAQPQHV